MGSETYTEAQMRALSDQMLAAYNQHDIEAFVGHLSDDVLWTEPSLVAPVRGRQAVREALKDTFTAFPDLRVLEEDFRIYPDVKGQSLVVTWTTTGTMTAALENGVPATGMSIRMSGANLIRFRGDKISEYTFYYDSLGMMQQLGLLPKSDGLSFRAIVLADVMAGKARRVLQRH